MFLHPIILLSLFHHRLLISPSSMEYNEQQTTAAPISVGQSVMSFASQRQCDADLLSHPAHEELRNEDNVLVSSFNSNTVGQHCLLDKRN